MIVFTILFLCIISTCRGGTITGSISFTPTTIRTSSTYTFNIVNSRLLQANEIIQILFPTSDYDFSSQSTTTESKTCTPLTGITSTGISSCTLDKSSNILKITLGAATTSFTISFTVASIINPQYSKTTSSISITSQTSGGTTIDSSNGSFTVTATPGALGVTLTSATYTVGATENLKISLTLTNSISPDGKIVIVLPKWNTSSPSPSSIFASGNPVCTAVTNISSIACAFTTNIDTSSTQDQIIVTGTITTGATSIEINITNYHNPPSTKPVTGILIYTTTNVVTNILDRNDGISLTMTTAATMASSSVTITPTDSAIQRSTTYTFSIRVFNPLPVGCSIIITFPSEISPSASTVAAVGTGKLNSLIQSDYNSATKALTLTDVIISQSNYVNSGEYIQFTLTSITNPTTTVTSSAFNIKTMDAVYYSIESGTNGITVTATPGDITKFTVSPSNTKIRERTIYSFVFTTENSISVGSVLTIIFPSEITVDNRSATSCVSGATSISSTSAKCTVTDNKTLVISSGFTSAVTAGIEIIFSVDSITNANTAKPTSNFQSTFADSSSNSIDTYKYTNVTYTFIANTLQSLTITPTSQYTGVETTYTIVLTTATDKPILANSILKIIIPDDITVGNTVTSAASCGSASGFSGTISCSYSSSNTLVVSNGFTSALTGATAQFSVGGIRNPRSTATTLSFKFYANDASNYAQYAVESGLGITVSTVSDFTAISISRDSTVNSVSTTYYFTITLGNVIVSGDYIRIVFPAEISISSIVNQCKGITNLSSSLVCSLTGNTIYVLVSLLSGVSQLPTVTGDTSTKIQFSISSVVNPASLASSSTLQIYTMTSSQNNLINQRTTGLSITNTQAGTFTIATAYPDSTDLGVTTNYLITIQPPNSIAQNTVIKVTIPSQIGISSSGSVSCSSVLIIESTLTCTYDSSSRTLTISNGFLAKTSYVSTQIEFKITNLVNPSVALTTDSFVIQTMTAGGILYNSISSGVTYTKPCNSPCKTCESDLSTCTSCYTTSDKSYLSQSKCVASCPTGEYTDSSNVCHTCKSPCATCITSDTNCLSCTLNPQFYLLNSECVSSCPDLYTVSSDGISCEKTGEIVAPFIGLFFYLMFIVVLAIIKLKWRKTMYMTTLIASTSYLFILLLIIIFSLQYRDSHFQSGTITLVSFCILILLNVLFTVTIYRTEIRRDILFTVWKEVYPKTEKFIYICNYMINFQCVRLTYCQFANLQRCDASIQMAEMMNIKLNRFTIFQILFVLLPTFCACFYNLFWTTYERQVFWNDIELIVILAILIIVMVLDVWTKDESALLENYVDKSEFEKHIDVTNKSLISNTILATKEDLLTNRTIYGEGSEKDRIQKIIYDKFGHIVSKDEFNKNIKNFDKLIHIGKEEEVISENSEKVQPNKIVNNFGPFRRKYRQNSPSKIRNSQSLSDEELHDEDNSQIEVKDDTTNNQSTHKHGDSSYGSNLDQNLNIMYRTGGSNMVQKEMMKNTFPANKIQHFPVEIESHAVINARGELKNQLENNDFLEVAKENLNKDINNLNNEIAELEKKKLVITLARYSIASGDLLEKEGNKKDRETDSRGTQYLRSDLYGESHEDQIKDNVEKSLKAENNARKWLMNNHNLITASAQNRRALSSSNKNYEEEKKLKNSSNNQNNNSSSKTKKKLVRKLGPTLMHQIPTSGLKDDLGWTFSDGVSDGINHGSVDIDGDNDSNRRTLKYDENSISDQVPKKNKAKKIKEKNMKNIDKKNSDASLEFYKNKKSVSNSSIQDASKGSTPKFLKDKVNRDYEFNYPEYTPKRNSRIFIENSTENEGGSIGTLIRNHPDYLSYYSSNRENIDNFNTEKGKEIYMKFQNEYISNKYPHIAKSKIDRKSVPRPNKYRTCVISPRAQDRDYNAEIYDNSVFERNYSENEISFGHLMKNKKSLNS